MPRRFFAILAALLALSVRSANGQTLQTVVSFDGANSGNDPSAGLFADSSGNFYGTTALGGPSGGGTVFKIAAGGGTLSTLASFGPKFNADPVGGVIVDSSGNIYGTTFSGGIDNDGTVFKIAAGTGRLTTLATFNGTNGAGPIANLIADGSGNLYGTTSGTVNGTRVNDGTVFKIAAGTGSLTTLAEFSGTNGDYPNGGLFLDKSGNLYGTTEYGGDANEDGTVFKITGATITGGTPTLSTLVTFNGSDGTGPIGTLISDASGNLYGTTTSSKSGGSTVFKIDPGTGSLTTLATLSSSNGGGVEAGVIMDSAGNLYGTALLGGSSASDGTVFKVSVGTNAVTTLATFNLTNGANPEAGLIADSSGNLYGTAQNGGQNYDGTVFEVTDAGYVTPEPGSCVVFIVAMGWIGMRPRITRRKPRMPLADQ